LQLRWQSTNFSEAKQLLFFHTTPSTDNTWQNPINKPFKEFKTTMIKIIRQHSDFFTFYLIFAFCGLLYQFTLTQFDAIYFCSDHQTPFTNRFFIFCTHLGEWIPYVFFAIYCFSKSKKDVLLPIVTSLMVFVVAEILKRIFHHPRPYEVLLTEHTESSVRLVLGNDTFKGTASFPSGHTMSAFAIYGLMCFMFATKLWQQLALFGIAVLVGLSRIYLTEHFPEDVLFGSFCGICIAMFIYHFRKYFEMIVK
jgi:membrane-associated phospholipid phosphatase